MLIILCLYLVLVWLIFSKLKLIKWGWASGTVAVLGGAFILAVFLAMFNYLTPSGSFVIVSRVVEVTPNVSGQVISIPVKTNVPVKAEAVLFQIDQAPFQYKVNQLEASLVQAEQQARQLKANYEQATANVEGLTKQLAYNTQRLTDIDKLTAQQATSVFRAQDTQVQFETVSAQLQAAKAAQLSAKIAMDSEIGGVNTTVAQIQAQLESAKWELEQTTVRAPGDGVVTVMALATGDRALQARSAMSFIITDEITIIGMFSPNGFATIKPDAPVKLVFDSLPGRIYHGGDAGARRLDRRRQGLSGCNLDSERHRPGEPASRHAWHRNGVCRQRRRHRPPDVDPGVDQLLHCVFIGSNRRLA